MRLSFRGPHLSITSFPDTDLPDFTLISGLNGTGKTHLLKAIQGGKIAIDVAQNTQTEIRFFDWNSLVPNEANTFDSQTLIQERLALSNQIPQAAAQQGQNLLNAARNQGVPPEYCSSLPALRSFLSGKLDDYFPTPETAKQVRSNLETLADNASNGLLNSQPSLELRYQIQAIATESGCKPIFLTPTELKNSTIPAWGQQDVFQQSLGRLFVAYRDLWLKNQLKILAVEKRGANHTPLTDDEFMKKYNIPPWDFVNNILKGAGLNFEIDAPDEYENLPYKPVLRKSGFKETEISFTSLSSGEKVLMSLALCIYYSQDKRQISSYPKVLLLDEIDAPLHPSMSRKFLETIVGTLVRANGLKVIAVTHSPSTLALAPEDSIYIMRPDCPGLHKTNKGEALNILTAGVPTLAISYEGRRQIFVESPNDSDLFDTLYQVLKSYLGSERSLEFVATGSKSSKSGTDVNTGCVNVIRIVEALANAGNKSVFGLIDWDGTNDPSERVEVLAHKTRNGPENILLDPLLIVALLIRKDRTEHLRLGLTNESYAEFLGFEVTRLQEVVDNLQAIVLDPETKDAGRVEVCYLGNFSLFINDIYLKMDDHLLFNLLIKKIPSLNSIAKGSSHNLMKYIADNILPDKPEFTPIEIANSFKQLLAKETH